MMAWRRIPGAQLSRPIPSLWVNCFLRTNRAMPKTLLFVVHTVSITMGLSRISVQPEGSAAHVQPYVLIFTLSHSNVGPSVLEPPYLDPGQQTPRIYFLGP